MDRKDLIPLLAMPLLLLAVEFGAILLSLPVQASGITAFEDPSSMENPVIFIAILLGFTIFLLVLIRYNLRRVIAGILTLAIFFTFVYIFMALVYAAMGATAVGTKEWWDAVVPASAIASADAAGITATLIVFILAALATFLLYRYPEWYVIDALGILIGSGVAAIFGASLEVLPVVLLLAILAVYDAISVYKTKHMITLAEGVVDLKTPILFVVPKRRDYSFIKEGIGKITGGEGAEGEKHERAAFIIGMGDLIMPAILVVSANVFLTSAKYGGLVNLPALGAIVGSAAGLIVLLHFVMSGRPQAGLPPINGGAILGFLIGWAAVGWV